MKKITLLIALIISHFGFSQIIEVSLEEKIKNSDYIVEAVKTSENFSWDEKKTNIYTISKLQILKTFKGEDFNELELLTLGGTVGDYSVFVCPTSSVQKDEKVILFLRKANVNFKEFNSLPKVKPYAPQQSEFYIHENFVSSNFDQFKGKPSEFYSKIESLTKKKYKINDIVQKKTESSNFFAAAIDPIFHISPTSLAGGIGSVLTINGTGFGATQGTKVIWFRNADNPSFIVNSNLLTVVSWSDTEIKVIIPGKYNFVAGSGKIVLSETNSPPLIYSQEYLTIPYSIMETNGGVSLRHYNQNSTGGMSFKLNTVFDANTDAKNRFIQALDYWSCSTNINWIVDGTTTTSGFNSNDNENVVFYSSSLDAGVLAQCSTGFFSCGTIISLDIAVKSTITWNYTLNSPQSNEVDFLSVILHELGHGRALNHINNNQRMMFYAIGSGQMKRVIHQDEADAGLFVQNLSQNFPTCGYNAMTAGTCLNLSNENFQSIDVDFYPNPTHDFVTIDSLVDTIKVYNSLGQEVVTKSYHEQNQTKVDLSSYSNGIYFIKISTVEFEKTIKIIKQ